jgi:ABC-2 type transport system permease protein
MFRSVAGFIIRTSAFVTKELVEILRQTRLLLALVLGPFLILLLFGIGYRNEARPLRTLFVVPSGQQQTAQQVQEYATTLGPQLDFRGAVSNEGEALAQLTRGNVDAVVIVPDQIDAKIKNSEQPEVRLLHREIDPAQVSYVQYFAQIYVDELNRRVLRSIAEQGQQEAGTVQEDLQTAKASASAMRVAFEQGNAREAQRQRQQMNRSMDAVSVGLGASLGVLQGVEQTMGPGSSAASDTSASQILSTIDSFNTNNEGLEDTPEDQSSYSAEAERAATIEQDLERLDSQLQDFRQISPQVLVSPFTAQTSSINNLELNPSDFFAPGVIILLLQHLLVTFSALSIVRERNSGTMELFRVAPVSAFETLLGKYISYMVIGVLLAAAISALVVFVLGVPMLGNWGYFSAALAALMFAALGVGFVISLLSQTTSQAVQYSMLMLLFSIFFSGFFLDLRLMWDQIRFISWGIPATYGLRLLQEVMFRANLLSAPVIGGLLAYGVVMFILSWILLGRQMRQS